MTLKNLFLTFAVIVVAVGLPFAVIHAMAAPDDAAITPLQRITAAMANFAGPWGGAIVQLVDFPNAGLRSFSWTMALGLTMLGVLLLLSSLRIRGRTGQVFLSIAWGVFMVIWFGVGLGQIADGLL